ncbi:DUF2715 domain-containing protein [Treponema pallidum]|nr:DUF2715 domain-containing protein [Treponema pallidum]QUJ39755.2 DUF2715 domain-containing protein [Treponema pallidum]QUJ43610.2 DUF2715 domain-containing protein [Treponema pallidum]QUJ86144.2 DUF2715 domain-containing protein [Treponema pallidum]QUJ87109.2 DUF2715 domain-containing protein [Treponema pallidum]QUJ88071.2 DUF2715 domain-containing protein [Treponema pallidum]
MLPGVAARVSLSPKLGVYGDARGGSDLWGICIQAPTMPDTENQAPPRYAPETPLVGLDVAFRAENGFLLQLTVDAALTRLMFCGRCLAGYSFRPGEGSTHLSVAAGFECTALIYDSQHFLSVLGQGLLQPSSSSYSAGNWHRPRSLLGVLTCTAKEVGAIHEESRIKGVCQNYAVPVQLGVQHYFGAHWGIDATATVSFGIDTKLAKFRIPYTLRVGPVFRT